MSELLKHHLSWSQRMFVVGHLKEMSPNWREYSWFWWGKWSMWRPWGRGVGSLQRRRCGASQINFYFYFSYVCCDSWGDLFNGSRRSSLGKGGVNYGGFEIGLLLKENITCDRSQIHIKHKRVREGRFLWHQHLWSHNRWTPSDTNNGVAWGMHNQSIQKKGQHYQIGKGADGSLNVRSWQTHSTPTTHRFT